MSQPVNLEEVKVFLRSAARQHGLSLDEKRLEEDASAWRSYQDAISRLRRVELEMEAEPVPVFRLTADTTEGR